MAISLGLIIAGLLASGSARVALIGAGIVLLVLIPALIQHRLEALAERVSEANREQAAELQRTFKSRALVSLFAPSAWVTLQDAQLALRLGDGNAAARLFAETARRCRRPDAVMLVSAQAHALVVANDRKGARELLNTLAAAKLLGPRDQLDLGIVLLLETNKKSRQAMAYLEAARKTIGDHPWVGAAMALGLQRAERVDEAAELLEKAQMSLQDEPDAVVEVMVHRARREMRRYIEAQLRRERRARSRRATVIVTSEHAVSEIISGEISSRDGSGATTQTQESAAAESTVDENSAEDAADREALRARGWQNPSSFAGRSDEAKPAKPKVKVELRDTSVGEPIRIEGSYALKTKAAIEADRPKDRRRRQQDPGPAIDIDLTVDEDDEDELPSTESAASPAPTETEKATEEIKKASEEEPAVDSDLTEGVPAAAAEEAGAASESDPSATERDAAAEADPSASDGEVGAASEADASGAAGGDLAQESAPLSGVSASLVASLNENGEVRQAQPRDEASALRRRGALSESLVTALSALDSASLSASSTEREADAPQPTDMRKPTKASGEADAPVAMRRGRSSAYSGALPKPPPFPSLGRGLGQGNFGAFAPPKPRIESDPSLASFKPEGGEKK